MYSQVDYAMLLGSISQIVTHNDASTDGMHNDGPAVGPPVSCALRGERRKLGGMGRGRARPGAPVESHHPPLCNAARLQLRSALPCLT